MYKVNRLARLDQIFSDIHYFMSLGILILSIPFLVLCFIEAKFGSIPIFLATCVYTMLGIMVIYCIVIIVKNSIRNKIIKSIKDIIIKGLSKVIDSSFTIHDNKDLYNLSFFVDIHKKVSCDDIYKHMQPLIKNVERTTNIRFKLYLTSKTI